MFKKSLLALFVLAIPMLIGAQTLKFGYCNSQEIFKLMPDLSKVEDAMAKFNQDNAKYLQDMETEIQKKSDELQSKGDSLTPTMQQLKQKELQDLYSRYQQAGQALQTEGQKKQQELLLPIQNKIKAAINAVGDKQGYLFIFDDATGALVYKSSKATDVTALVKKELGIM